MKIEELIQRVQSLYSKGVQSDDSRLTSRHIYNKLTTVRAKLVTEEAKKNQIINNWNYQTLPCVELVKAAPHECPCLPAIGCDILKSRYELPKPITDLGKHIIHSVTSLDRTGSISYSMIDFNQLKYIYANKYTSKNPVYWIRNNYLYTSYIEGPKVVAVTLLAEDPLQAKQFPSFCDESCVDCQDCTSPLDLEFPIDNDKIDVLIELCVNELVVLFSKTVEDISNNTKDSESQQQTK